METLAIRFSIVSIRSFYKRNILKMRYVIIVMLIVLKSV